MTSASDPPSVRLRRMVNGYQVTQTIHAAATLGIADLLAEGERDTADLAQRIGADPDALYRLLRALAGLGVLHEADERHFSLTELGACLRSDAPEPVGGWAAFVGQSYHWQAWGELLHSVRTGETAFEHIHGTDVWNYRAEHPELGATFDGAMTAISRQVSQAVVEAFDFGRYSSIVDVGGGNGAFLVAILHRYPAVRGTLFDLPHVVARAQPVLAVVAGRCQVAGGNMFESVPPGGDAYVLKSLLHDWDDDHSRRILRVCRGSMRAGAAILVVERDLGMPNEQPDAKLSDLNMLVATGGRERTAGEYAALLATEGFQLDSVTPTAKGVSVFAGTAI